MRIALLIESLAGGGSERVIERLSRGLAQRGHHVFVYCLRSALQSIGRMAAGGVIIREARSVGRDPLLAWRLARWLRQDRIEIVHAHSCAALAWVFPGAKLLGLPLLHVWHGWPLEMPTRYHRLAERLDRFVDRVGINSESLRTRFAPGRLARAATYLPNGIDLPTIARDPARVRLEALCGCALTSPLVLCVGNLRAEKDVCGMLAAFALLRRDWPQAQLIWLGATRDDDYGRAVQRTVQALQLLNSAHFPGPCSEAWRLMPAADVFCLSSRTESMPNVVLEAMSQQVPIVATTVGDVGRLGTHALAHAWLLRHAETALLAPPGAPEALAAALDYALRDRTAARRRAACAYDDYRRRFTLDQMVRRYEQVYYDMRRVNHRRRAFEPRGSVPAKPRPGVLMLGPAAPQIGGMVTSISLLLDSPLRKGYRLSRFATTTNAAGAALCPSRWSRIGRCAASILRHIFALGRLVVTLLASRIDLLHIHTCSQFTFYRNLLDLAVAKLLRRAVVFHIRGGQFEYFCRTASPPGQWLIRRGLTAADAVLVLSEHWRTALRPFASRTLMYVVPTSVDVGAPPERQVRDAQPCRFLYLAALTRAKGLDDLLAAATELRAADVPFELLIAGPAPEEPQAAWEARARAAGLADITTFLGPVTGVDKQRWLAAADCLVHPSHSEALPNAVLEAAAAGLPVIATAIGSLTDLMLVGQRAEPLSPLVPPHDPHALALEMRRLACDPALRRRISDALYRHVAAHYAVPRVAARLARVYEEVLAHRCARPPVRAKNAGQTRPAAEAARALGTKTGANVALARVSAPQNTGVR